MTHLTLYFAVFFISLWIGVNADLVTFLIEETQEECKNQTKIEQTLIDQAINGHFSDNKKLKDYYSCYGLNIGYIRNEGVTVYGPTFQNEMEHIDRENLAYWLMTKLQYDPKSVEDALSSCVSHKLLLEMGSENLYERIKCLNEKCVPVDVVSTNYVDQTVEDLNAVNDYCKTEHDIDQNLIDEAQHNGNFIDSEKIGLYYTCYALENKFIDWYGVLQCSNLELWLKKILKHDSSQVDGAIRECCKDKTVLDLDKLPEEALKIVKCFADEGVSVDVLPNQ